MDSDAAMIERHSRLLARFAEQAAALAEDLCAAALAAETPEAKQSLSFAFHRMGRALRQSCALEARLRRDHRRDERGDQERAAKVEAGRLEVRKAKVRAAVEQLVWDEVEPDDWAAHLQLLEDRLDGADLADPEVTIEALIHSIAKAVGLPSTVIPRSGGTPDPGDVGGGLADSPSQLGSPASPPGRAADDAGEWRSAAPPIPDHPFRSSG